MRESMDRVREHFARVDAATTVFAEQTSLACAPGCGACCLAPEVETTAAELLPLAASLVDQGRAPGLLAELASNVSTRCVLYAPEGDDPLRGRCTVYHGRPLICRLFGFSARRNRLGATELLACRTMRAAIPDTVRDAERSVASGAPAPLAADFAHALAADLPGEGVRSLPINTALRQALERELLERRLLAWEATSHLPDDGNPEDPPAAPLGQRPAA